LPKNPGDKAIFAFVITGEEKGQLEFQDGVMDVNFHANKIQGVTVTSSPDVDAEVTVFGLGAVNGDEGYSFLMKAGEGDPGTFLIQICEGEGPCQGVVYTTEEMIGSIKIHK